MGILRTRPSNEILSGESADVYFARAESVLEREGLDPMVVMEVFSRESGILCGIDEAKNLIAHVLGDADPSEVEAGGARRRRHVLAQGGRPAHPRPVPAIRAVRDGDPGHARPIHRLGDRCPGVRRGGRPHPVISFGARHVHPDITDVLDYAAIVGGCVGASTPAGARLAGLTPTGTMPHSLVLIFGDTVEAALAFDRDLEPDIPRIVLIDTFKDEAEEALRVAHALGDRLYGIRLDTPAERGRVTADLVIEIRARLDLEGFEHVKIVVSGGLSPERIRYFAENCRAGRLVRGGLVHQRCGADRLHRRHQGDRRAPDRQARPDPGPDRQPAATSGGPGRLAFRRLTRPRRQHEVRPLDTGDEPFLAIQLEGALVAGLDRQLDLGQADRAEVADAPAQELPAETPAAPLR